MPDENEVVSAHLYYAPLMMFRGVLAVISGLILLLWPNATLAVVGVTAGLFLIAGGIERIVTVLRRPKTPGDGIALVSAVLHLIFGALLLFRPVQTGSFWFSFFFIAAGLHLAASSLYMIRKDPGIRGDFVSAAAVLTMLILGLLLIVMPLFSAVLMLRILGAVMILTAVPSLAAGIRSRRKRP